MLTIASLLILPQASSAGDYIRISKVHQSFSKVLDLQTFYVDDSMLIQTSRVTLLDSTMSTGQIEVVRLVRFDAEMVYEIFPMAGVYAEIPLGRFQELYREQQQEALKRSQERAEAENRILKDRRRSFEGSQLRRKGRWKERFDWRTDTLLMNVSVDTWAGPGHITRVQRIGEVKKRDDDTLYVDRILQTVPENRALLRLSAALARTCGQDDDAGQFLHWYFQKYHFTGSGGFLSGINMPVPADAGFDTTMIDSDLPVDGLPTLTTLRVHINQRNRNPIVFDKLSASFADQDYAIKALVEEHVFQLDSLTVMETVIDTTWESFTTVPQSFISTDFKEDRVLRFFD